MNFYTIIFVENNLLWELFGTTTIEADNIQNAIVKAVLNNPIYYDTNDIVKIIKHTKFEEKKP